MRSAAANWADFTFDEFRGERHSEKVAIRARIGLGDELAGATSSLRVTLCVAPPAPCGDAHFDAAVAAVVEHHLAKDLRVLWMYLPTRNQKVNNRLSYFGFHTGLASDVVSKSVLIHSSGISRLLT